MEWIGFLLSVCNLSLILHVLHRVKQVNDQGKSIEQSLLQFRVRQSNIKLLRTSTPVKLERAKTSIRDTADIPATARMGIALKRKKSHGRQSNDD